MLASASVAVALVLLTSAIVAAGSAITVSTASPRVTGLPDCHADTRPASHSDYDGWADTLLDPAHSLPEPYVPPDLSTIMIGDAEIRLRAFVVAPLRQMLDRARRAGVEVTVSSGYRSFAEQHELARTLDDPELVAKPGHSEHQLGTAVDLRGGWEWLARNSWRYGFVLSYPEARSPHATCYRHEPWHFRYVGPERAAQVHASGLSLREWLWLETRD